MSEIFRFKVIFLWFTAAALLLLSGCGGSGSGGSADPASLIATLATGKLTVDGGATQDILFASVGGAGVAGGWIEDVNGNKLAGSDLVMENTTGRYEVMVARASNGFAAGTYVLKYFVNSETLEYKRENLDWVNAAQFVPAPSTPSWNPTNNILTVGYQPVNGSSVRYYLRIYSAITGTLYRETIPTNGLVITENISFPGQYRVVLTAEVLENDRVVSTAKHNFTTVIQAAVRAPAQLQPSTRHSVDHH